MTEDKAEALLDHLRDESSYYLHDDRPSMSVTFISGPIDSVDDAMRIDTFPTTQRFPVNLLTTRLKQIELSVGHEEKRWVFTTVNVER